VEEGTPASSTKFSLRATRVAQLAVLIVGGALLVAPWFGHFDDTDAQLYEVVVRKMAGSRAYLDPRYLDQVYPHFREHLPFGLWPYAVAASAFGEHASRVLAAVFSFLTLVGILEIGKRLLGVWPAIAGTLVLATTDSFFGYGGAVRLDPLLVLLANAAAVPELLRWRSRRSRVAACGLAAGAMLVKPFFGLVPFVAAAASNAACERSWRPLGRGMAGALLAAIPLFFFLVLDRLALHAGWWDGYLRNQIVGSALGTRPDGSPQWWFPLATIAGRFWPGLVLVLVTAFVRDRRTRQLWFFCALMLLALCLPGRKVWNHSLVAYPGLALLAGSALLPAVGWFDRYRSRIAAALLTASMAALVAVPWIGRAVDGRPCVGAAEFAEQLGHLAAGETILVASSPTSWRMIASLAAERGLEPDPRTELVDDAEGLSRMAIVEEARMRTTSTWREISRARGWVLLRRKGGTRASSPSPRLGTLYRKRPP
jgi:4-amino-4-deoxy-L-arabinose transferase-like glycosyltransferase